MTTEFFYAQVYQLALWAVSIHTKNSPAVFSPHIGSLQWELLNWLAFSRYFLPPAPSILENAKSFRRWTFHLQRAHHTLSAWQKITALDGYWLNNSRHRTHYKSEEKKTHLARIAGNKQQLDGWVCRQSRNPPLREMYVCFTVSSATSWGRPLLPKLQDPRPLFQPGSRAAISPLSQKAVVTSPVARL